MNLQKITKAIGSFIQTNKATLLFRILLRDLGWKKFILSLSIGAIAGGVILALVLPSNTQETKTSSNNTAVTLKTVADIASGHSSISLIGEVESVSEATIYSQASGIVKYVSYSLGDTVARNSVIAEIENSRERAAVMGARAVLSRAQGAQTRNVVKVYTDAANTYRQAFTRASNAVFGQTDSFFTAPRTSDPRLNISSFGKFFLEKKRGKINDILAQWEEKLPDANDRDRISSLLVKAEENTRFIKLFLDQLATIVSRQTADGSRTQATINSEKAGLFAAQSNIDASLLAITNRLNELDRTLPKQKGGTGEADANIETAKAALASTNSMLEKTIIRAPIGGALNSLNIKAGDFIGIFTPVATVANNGTLEIITFVSDKDRPRLAVGDTVKIEGGGRGVVTKIAPALNPTTKKIEVKIGVEDGNASLINGSTVRLSIFPTEHSLASPGSRKDTFLLPFEALKLTDGKTFVFSVDTANQTLVAYPVVLVRIVGDSVEISDIDPSLKIVTDVRGLFEGQQVEIQNN